MLTPSISGSFRTEDVRNV